MFLVFLRNEFQVENKFQIDQSRFQSRLHVVLRDTFYEKLKIRIGVALNLLNTVDRSVKTLGA